MKALYLTEDEKALLGGSVIGLLVSSKETGNEEYANMALSIYEKIKAASSAKTVESMENTYLIAHEVLPKYSGNISDAMFNARHEMMDMAKGMNSAGKILGKNLSKGRKE